MDLSKLNKAIKAYREALEEASKQLGDSIKDLIRNTPGVEAVQWDQHTPYFNDGEPCEFIRYDFQFKLDGQDEFDECYGNKQVASLREALGAVPDDVYESAFGDHVSVQIDSNDITTTDDSDHD